MSRKDAFPGADGSTIIEPTTSESNNANTISIYGADGSALVEGTTLGLRLVNISTSGVLSGNTSLLYATKNPLTFICNNTTLGDWYTTNEIYQKPTLWGDGTNKSAFDPCPQNWRVPPDASFTFGDFATASTASGSGFTINAGSTYNNMAWFPMAGRRRYTSGGLYAVGNYGYCWSTSVRGTYAKALSFHMNGSFFGNDNGRAFGFSVRCVQE